MQLFNFVKPPVEPSCPPFHLHHLMEPSLLPLPVLPKRMGRNFKNNHVILIMLLSSRRKKQFRYHMQCVLWPSVILYFVQMRPKKLLAVIISHVVKKTSQTEATHAWLHVVIKRKLDQRTKYAKERKHKAVSSQYNTMWKELDKCQVILERGNKPVCLAFP